MNIKEAIKWVKNIPKIRFYLTENGKIMMTNRFKDCTEKEYYEDINKVIELLQRGEKYEQMWEEDAKEWLGNDLDLEEWMNDTKQKYFPKENK